MSSNKRKWCLPCLLGMAFLGSAAYAHAEEIFRDDFNRYGNPDVGNGWIEIERDTDDVMLVSDASNGYLRLKDHREGENWWEDEPDAAATRMFSTEGYEDIYPEVRFDALDASLDQGDVLFVEYTVNGGTSWSTWSAILNYDGWRMYKPYSPLDALANNNPNFGIRFKTDLKNESTTSNLNIRGALIDYVVVTGTPLAPPADTTPPSVSKVTAGDVEFPSDVNVTATATDAQSNIKSAEYSRDGTPWVAMSAADGAFDEFSEDLTATLSGLFVKTHEVCVRAADVEDNQSNGSTCDLFDVTAAQLSITFAGPLLDIDGSPTELKAELTGPCSSGAKVEFFADFGSGYQLLDTETTDLSGVATLNADLPAGIHDIKVAVAGQNLGGDDAVECVGDWDSGVTVVPDANASSTGGGWYKIEGLTPPRVNFGYTAQTKYNKKLREDETKGNLVWMHQDSWRLKGVIDGGGKLPDGECADEFAECAAFAGTGTLYEYNSNYDPYCPSYNFSYCGLEWINPSPNTPFIFFANDGGTSRECIGKKKCKEVEKPDQFGIQISLEALDAESESGATEDLFYLNGGNLVVK